MHLALFAAILVGCSKDEPEAPPAPGTISLAWRVGAQGCDAAGITEIAVIAGDTEELASFACGNETGVVEGVDPGRYELAIVGRDGTGVDRYSAEAPGVVVESGADSPLGTVTLSALPGEIAVIWVFDDGRLCGVNDAETVVVRLFDAGDAVGQEATSPCDEGVLTLTDVPGGEWTVDVEALNAVGFTTWRGTAESVVEAGGEVETLVTLVAEGGA